MEASPSRSDSFERLDGVGCSSFSGSAAVSFIEMDPADDLFSMRWTTTATSPAAEEEFDPDLAFAMAPFGAGAGGHLLDLLLPSCERASSVSGARDDVLSSPLFHTARSTPVTVITAPSRGRAGGSKAAPLLATRRILLRYLRFLVPLCRKAGALPLRVFAAGPRYRASRTAASSTSTSTPARQSTSSFASASEYWCHGNADTAVRDAILHCKKSYTFHGHDM